jgi:hypothetical protein
VVDLDVADLIASDQREILDKIERLAAIQGY